MKRPTITHGVWISKDTVFRLGEDYNKFRSYLKRQGWRMADNVGQLEYIRQLALNGVTVDPTIHLYLTEHGDLSWRSGRHGHITQPDMLNPDRELTYEYIQSLVYPDLYPAYEAKKAITINDIKPGIWLSQATVKQLGEENYIRFRHLVRSRGYQVRSDLGEYHLYRGYHMVCLNQEGNMAWRSSPPKRVNLVELTYADVLSLINMPFTKTGIKAGMRVILRNGVQYVAFPEADGGKFALVRMAVRAWASDVWDDDTLLVKNSCIHNTQDIMEVREVPVSEFLNPDYNGGRIVFKRIEIEKTEEEKALDKLEEQITALQAQAEVVRQAIKNGKP